MAQSPEENAATTEIIRYDLGWNAINAMLRSGRSLSGHERNCCFLNTGGGRFADVSAAAGLDFVDDGRVLALADWDFDGDLDFWIANRSGPQVRYVRNETIGNDDPDAARHFVAFQLEGVECNRDAIGAQVTIHLHDHSPGLQRRSVQAGDGYLSQSSKWLHFGLGDATRIAQTVVRWPNGREHVFENLDANNWYRLREGDAEPEVWTPPVSLKPLATSDLVSPPVTDQARIVLLAPVPLPELHYQDTNGQQRSLNETADGARLINLWATWCQPCLTELADWREHSSELERAGLRVLTINVDEHADQPDSAERAAAVAVLDRLQLPFENGFGSEKLATMFDAVQRSFLSRQRPLPLPSSFLIDSEGRLRVVYKGPVSAETLAADARLVDAEPAETLAAATPLAGRWHAPPGGSTPLNIALTLVGGGLAEDAERYIQWLLDQGDAHPEYLSAGLLNILGALSLDGQKHEQAAVAFSRALALDPHNRQSRIELGTILLRYGKGAEAAPHFEQLLRSRPNDPEMMYKLGMARLQQGDLPEAERRMRGTLALRPHPLAYWKLGDIYVGMLDANRAIAAYEAALELDPKLIRSANNLAWLLATISDDNLRDGRRAVEIAEKICSSVETPSSNNLDTLAAAYAEQSRFDDAARTARQAIAAATNEGNQQLADTIRSRLQSYQQRKPFRESLGPVE